MTSHSRLNAVAQNVMALAAAPAVLELATRTLEQRFANVPVYGFCVDHEPQRTIYTAEQLLAEYLDHRLPSDFGSGQEWCREVLQLIPLFQLGIQATALLEAVEETVVS